MAVDTYLHRSKTSWNLIKHTQTMNIRFLNGALFEDSLYQNPQQNCVLGVFVVWLHRQ